MPIVTKRKYGGRPRRARRTEMLGAVAIAAVVAAMLWQAGGSRFRATAGGTETVPSEGNGARGMEPVSSDAGVSRFRAPEGGTELVSSADEMSGISNPSTFQPSTGVSPTIQPSTVQPADEPGAVAPGPSASGSSAPMFDNQVENRLEAVSRQGFNSIVTLRVNLPREEIVEILKRPVEIYDDDDEATVEAKERTAEMKAAALEFIEAGGTFNQFLRDCQAAATEAREAVRDVRDEMKRILLEQGEEAAQAYLDRQNPMLREQGLEEVHIGKGLLRMMEREKAR